MAEQMTIEEAFVSVNKAYEEEKAAADAYREAAIALIDHIANEAVKVRQAERQRSLDEQAAFTAVSPSESTH